jgi:hypothetical protein
MLYPTTQRGKRLFSITVTLLMAAGVNALPALSAGIKPLSLISSGINPISAQIFFHSGSSGPHILRNSPLYKEDTVLLNSQEIPGIVARSNHRVRSDQEEGKNSDDRGNYEARKNKEGLGFIRREKNGDLVIAIPNVVSEKYKIRFFDDDDNFLFEVRQIRDPLLIVEKYNFQHTGLFQYELYRESLLIERSTFLIRKD